MSKNEPFTIDEKGRKRHIRGGPLSDNPKNPQRSTNPRCPATSKTHGGPCRNFAGQGTGHKGYGLCYSHRGNTPDGIKAAHRMMAEATATAFGVAQEGVSPDQALEGELARCAGTVNYLADYLASVDPAKRMDGANAQFVSLYERERDRLVRVAKASIEAGIAERHVAAIEKSAEVFATVLTAILTELNVMDRPETPQIVQRHLALLDAGAPNG